MRLACLITVLCLTACFDLREPAPPGQASDWTPPNQPNILIDNLRQAVANLNVVNYERCFLAEKFRFEADPNVVRNNQGLFQNWTFLNHELEYVRNLSRLSQGSPEGQVTFTNTRTNNFSADSVEVIADYQLYIQHQDTAYRDNRFAGNAIFGMARNTRNEWQITRWRDTKTQQTLPCWSELKEHFVSR